MKKNSAIAVLILIVALSGWYPIHAQDGPSPVIRLWHPYTDEQQAQLDTLIAHYNAENTDSITIQATSFTDSGLLYDQIILQLTSTQQLPNLVMIWPHDAALFDLNNNLVDLDQYDLWHEDLLLPATTGRDPITQKHIAFPYAFFGTVLAVNQDALSELGYTALPSTWVELEDAACALRDKGGWSGGQFGVAWGLTGTLDAETILALSLLQTTPPFTAETYQFDTLTLYQSTSAIKSMYDKGCLILETDRATALDTFASGRALFLLLPSSAAPILQMAIERNFTQPFAWDVTIPPTADGMLIYTPSISMFNDNAADNAAAAAFLAWFLSPEINATWASSLNSFPIATTSEFQTDVIPQQRLWEQIQTTPLIPLPTLAGYDVVRIEIRFAFQRILANTTLVTDELPTLDTLANQITRDFYGLMEQTP